VAVRREDRLSPRTTNPTEYGLILVADDSSRMRKATTLGELDVFDYVRLRLTNGQEVEGRATAIDYVPDERLRLELRPRHSGVRYELSAEHSGSRWSPIHVRRCDTEADVRDWEDLGNVKGLSVRPDTPVSV
jgi:hypothetical protein